MQEQGTSWEVVVLIPQRGQGGLDQGGCNGEGEKFLEKMTHRLAKPRMTGRAFQGGKKKKKL